MRINDGPNYYVQYKDEFVRGIYHFSSDRTDPTIIDAGSNIGMSVLYFKRLYPQARIIAFEPDPAIARLLHENIERNGLAGVTVVEAGLGAEPGELAFMPDGTAGGRLDPEGELKVPVVRLSDYLTEPVDFLKMNIEGEELPVLTEAAATGRLRNIREMVLEYHGWAEGEQRLGQILELLDREGYRYMVHDFDAESNPVSKPPFAQNGRDWFCLVHAKRTDRTPG